MTMASESTVRVLHWARAVLAAWLIVSAFVLSHTEQSFGNTWTMGLLTLIVAVVGSEIGPKAMRVLAPFAAWLLLSTWLVPYDSPVTRVHNVLVSIALLALALMPARLWEPRGRAEQRATA